MEMIQASTEIHFDQVRALMRAFVEWHRKRHFEDLALIEAYFDPKTFEAELAGPPGDFAPPRGRLLLAIQQDLPAGCVAMREIDAKICEMKRNTKAS